MYRHILPIVVVSFMLAGCQSDEEKSARHFESAQAFAVQNNTPAALIELKNALKLDDTNIEARSLFARLSLEEGNVSTAFRAFKQVVEARPDSVAALSAMAGIAFDSNDLEGAQTYLERGLALSQADVELREVEIGIAYRKAVRAQDEPMMAQAARQAHQLVDVDQTRLRARRIAIAQLIRDRAPEAALEMIDAGLLLAPDDRGLANTKLVALNQIGSDDQIEAHIHAMLAMDPQDTRVQNLLMDWYLAQDRNDDAHDWLAGRIDAESDDPIPRVAYFRFISQSDGHDAMRAELREVLSTNPLPNDVATNLAMFKALSAGADFALGDTEKAKAELKGLLQGELAGHAGNSIRMQLASMEIETGQIDEAKTLIDAILTADPGHIPATKSKARLMIAEGGFQDATVLLRAALNDAPNDPELYTLLAHSFEREGKDVLVADMLVRAVEASNSGVAESLTYASHLFEQRAFRSAEQVLDQALRRNPRSTDLIAASVTVQLALQNWTRAEDSIRWLEEGFDSEESQQLAQRLNAQLRSAQGRSSDIYAHLDALSKMAEPASLAQLKLIRSLLEQGESTRAQEAANQLKRSAPDTPMAGLVVALVHHAQGDLEAARRQTDDVTRQHPAFGQGWLLRAEMAKDETGLSAQIEVLKQGLEAAPDNRQLALELASVLERDGQFEAAIEVYEALYDHDPTDLIVANNLVSLMTQTRSDPQSIQAAWAIAAPLEGTSTPAFLDTYGWAAYLNGDVEIAQSALERAAAMLPSEPVVIYHYATVLADVGESQKARDLFEHTQNLLRNGLSGPPSLAANVSAALAKLAQ